MKKKKLRKVVGFQIVKNDPEFGQQLPDEFYSFEILSKKLATEWLKKNNQSGEWQLVPVRYGEIEDPTYIK